MFKIWVTMVSTWFSWDTPLGSRQRPCEELPWAIRNDLGLCSTPREIPGVSSQWASGSRACRWPKLAFSVHRTRMKNTGTEFGGNRKVAFISASGEGKTVGSWPKTTVSPQPLWGVQGLYGKDSKSGVSDEEQRWEDPDFFLLDCFKDSHKLVTATH